MSSYTQIPTAINGTIGSIVSTLNTSNQLTSIQVKTITPSPTTKVCASIYSTTGTLLGTANGDSGSSPTVSLIPNYTSKVLTVYSSDPVVNAEFQGPFGITVDSYGNIYVSDTANHVVRKMIVTGIAVTSITTFAGTGTVGSGGDGGSATSATLNGPRGLAVYNNTLYISDSGNNKIRAVDLTTNVITTYYVGTTYTLSTPYGIKFDNNGTLYIADCIGNRIVIVPPSGGTAWVIGPLTSYGSFHNPTDMVPSPNGTKLYIVDQLYSNIVYCTISGTTPTYQSSVSVNRPYGITIDDSGSVWTASTDGYSGSASSTLYKINFSFPTSTTPYGPSATLVNPGSMCYYNSNIYFASTTTNRVVDCSTSTPSTFSIIAGNGSPGFQGMNLPMYIEKIGTYDMTSDFVFVDTSNTQFSQFYSGGTTQLFDTSFSASTILLILPVASNVSNQKAIYIKDKSWNATTNHIIVGVTNNGLIDSRPSATLKFTGSCLSLFSDLSNYYIANWYPQNAGSGYDNINGNSQPSMNSGNYTPNTTYYGPFGNSRTFKSTNWAQAQINCINIFNTSNGSYNSTTLKQYRQEGNNLITLPQLGLSGNFGAICFIVYCGNSNGDTYTYPLGMMSADSNQIDGPISPFALTKSGPSSSSDAMFPITKQLPVILTQAGGGTYENTGAILISDGTSWYFAGWMYPGASSFSFGYTNDQYRYSIPTTQTQFALTISGNVIPYTGTNLIQLPPSLPLINPANNIAYPYLFLSKVIASYNPGGSIGYTGYINSSTPPNVLNESINTFTFNSSFISNSCIWFIGEQRVGETYIHYYPICMYTYNSTT